MKILPSSFLVAAALFAALTTISEDIRPGPASAQPSTIKTDETSLIHLKQEKAALEKRLMEIDAEIIRTSPQQGLNLLGMSLVDPTEEALELYGFRKDSPLPMITEVNDPTFFPKDMTPYKGCAFWIVESPAKAFLFNHDTSPSYRPKNVHELIEAIVACTVTPEEYQKLWDRSKQAGQEYLAAMKDNAAERQRLKVDEWQMPAAEAGKYICRVVYEYPQKAGTMTTEIRMTQKDLDNLRQLLKQGKQ